MHCKCLFFLSLTLFVGLSKAQTPLVLALSATTVTEGEQLNASCTATVAAQSRLLHIDGQEVTARIPSSRLTSDPGDVTTTWIIDPVQRGDGGEYYCFAGGDQGSDTDSPPQNVTVHFPPDVAVAVPAVSVRSGESAEVVIFVEALPAVTGVQFTLPSAEAGNPSHNAVGVTSGNVTLTFTSVDRYYNGEYTAIFTNAAGPGMVDFELTVYFRPYFSHDGQEQEDGASITLAFAGGRDFSFVCNVSATNPAVLDLTLDHPNVDNVEFVKGTGTITITGATAANEGTYTCTANNGETAPTTISFVLRMDSPSSESTSTPTTDSAGNLVATVSVAIVMLLATIFLS